MRKKRKIWWEIAGHLEIKNGKLYMGNKATVALSKKYGTPLYVYNLNRISENYRRFYGALKKFADREFKILYAMKANSNKEILKVLARKGSGLDAVSPEEVELASRFFSPKDILFTGVNTSQEDLKRVIKIGAKMNVDSLSQLEKLKKLTKKGLELSFRVDPGTGGIGGNWKTITAGKESHGVPVKFGIPKYDVLKVYQKAKRYGFKPVGIHMHIGSQWLGKELNEFFYAVDELLNIAGDIIENLGCDLEFIDLGGGPGIRYKESDNEFPLNRYTKGVWDRVKKSGLGFKKIIFEPGRFIVGDAGILLCKVTGIKERYGNVIVGVNTGFNHIIRPILYNAYHEIINCNRPDKKAGAEVTVAGNLCETGDVLAVKRKMLMPKEGDILAFHNAGAYCSTMASQYNLRELPKEIVI